MKSARYCMFRENLYRSSFSRTLLRCLGPRATLKVMAEMQEDFCGNYTEERSMAQQIELQGFYWGTIMRDSEKYSLECKKCQQFASLHHFSSNELTSVTNPWPFIQWRLDIIGPFPKAWGQKKFILVATNHFSKY